MTTGKTLDGIEISERGQMLSDIASAAIESFAINYWCCRVGIMTKARNCRPQYMVDVIGLGGSLSIEEDKSEEGEPNVIHVLTGAKLMKGIKLAADHFGQSVKGFYENHDSISADCAFQFALFGKIIYS